MGIKVVSGYYNMIKKIIWTHKKSEFDIPLAMLQFKALVL